MLAVIDWTNAVVIPILIATTVGSMLAIWTGVIVSRLAEFAEAKRNAMEAISAISTAHLSQTRDEMLVIKVDIRMRLKLVQTEALRLRQPELFALIEYILNRVREYPWTYLDGESYPLLGAKRVAGFSNIYPFNNALISMIYTMQPSYLPIFLPVGLSSQGWWPPAVPLEKLKAQEHYFVRRHAEQYQETRSG